MERKGFGPRLLAALIDGFLVLALFCVASVVFGMGMQFNFGGSAALSGAARGAAIVGTLLGLAYGSTEIFLAGSPGKLLLKMKIGGETGVVPAPQAQLIRRWLVKWSPSLLNVLFAITLFRPFNWLANLAGLVIFVGCFFALGANRQTLHDVLAHTAVYGVGVTTPQGFQPIMGGGYAPGPGAGPVAGPGPIPPGGPGAPPPPPPPPPSM
jgi:hypothetical protein